LKKDFKAGKVRVYPLSRNKKEKVQKFVNKYLQKRYIQPSKSEQTLPVFFVVKKDRERRMVINY